MTLRIISAQEIIYTGTVRSVTLPGTMGAFTVLHNHASLIATLSAGSISYVDSDGNEQTTEPLPGGIADIDNNVISVCIY